MRLPSFLLPKLHASAIYCSAAPLFDFGLARQPLADGSYRSIADGSAIGFRWHDDSYRVSGDATPETVTLIPIAGEPDGYVFQQSAGRGNTFYGALRIAPDGFRLFSPENLRDDAIRNAKANGATLVQVGCVFADGNSLLAALLPLVATAPDYRWSVYRRA